MANHEDDIYANHKYANVENEFCYLPYDDTALYDDIRILPPLTKLDKKILPPVTKLDKKGHAIAHAVVCAVEARYHKQRKCCYTPKSIWRCSVKSLIQTMATRTKQEEGDWSLVSIDEAISVSGIGLAVDEDHPEQFCPKYRGIRLLSFKLDDVNPYDEVVDEIHENGPIIALIQPLIEDFVNWSPESAKERVYSGFSPLTKHAVALIGTSRFDDGRTYFIAQNCYGEEWGDKGVFRIMANDIVEFIVPVLPRY